jgi:glycosyltransferase involved in cell wall biosynthesis
MKQRVPGITLTLAGDGPRLAQCRRLAESLEVADRVTFLGATDHDDVLRRMHEAAVVVVPSRQEPFGIVVLEAMACGTPVVATRVGGIPGILTHMQEGLLVESERPRDMARAIERLLKDRPLSQSMGKRGRAKVLHQFTWDSVVKRYERAYSRALQRRGTQTQRSGRPR